jgi:hypothetical protein
LKDKEREKEVWGPKGKGKIEENFEFASQIAEKILRVKLKYNL